MVNSRVDEHKKAYLVNYTFASQYTREKNGQRRSSSQWSPAPPWENGFANLREAKALGEQRRRECNHERPHSSLGVLEPERVRGRVMLFP